MYLSVKYATLVSSNTMDWGFIQASAVPGLVKKNPYIYFNAKLLRNLLCHAISLAKEHLNV